MRRWIFGLAAVAVLATTPALADSCIRHDDIYSWSSINDKTLILENYRHQKWLIKLIGTCSDFKFHERLVIQSPGALAISCIERGDSVLTRSDGIRGRCAIMSIDPYTVPAKDNKSDKNNKSDRPDASTPPAKLGN
jgi:hypothetical protein